MKRLFLRRLAPAAGAAIALIGAAAMGAGDPAFAQTNAYTVTPLVSDLGGAPFRDRNLKNAWGVAFSPAGSPFWIADNATGKSTLYLGDGTPQSLVVKIPKKGGGASAPTGIVWNPAASFLVPGTTIPAVFIFDTEDGTIAAWAPTLPDITKAVLVPKCCAGAVYKGLAFGVNKSGPFLFATNFHAGTVDVFGPGFTLATTTGGFKDAGIPKGYAPFGIQNIDGNLIVTYALQDKAKHDDVPGDGHGFVDVFDTDGNMLKRLASRGGLNSPWGVARASFNFGPFSDDILIGNFGNGWINAVTPPNGKLVLLDDANGGPLFIDGLWNLGLGGGKGSSPSTLYFTAGPNGETNGLFGTITPK